MKCLFCSSSDVMPSENDVLNHVTFITEAVKRDKDLTNSKVHFPFYLFKTLVLGFACEKTSQHNNWTCEPNILEFMVTVTFLLICIYFIGQYLHDFMEKTCSNEGFHEVSVKIFKFSMRYFSFFLIECCVWLINRIFILQRN